MSNPAMYARGWNHRVFTHRPDYRRNNQPRTTETEVHGDVSAAVAVGQSTVDHAAGPQEAHLTGGAGALVTGNAVASVAGGALVTPASHP